MKFTHAATGRSVEAPSGSPLAALLGEHEAWKQDKPVKAGTTEEGSDDGGSRKPARRRSSTRKATQRRGGDED